MMTESEPVIQESSINEPENKQEELVSIDEKKQRTPENEEQKEITINNPEDDHRSKRSFHTKIKYSTISYHRSPYYTNGHPYGPSPYYYYQLPPPSVNEKPTPLMVIPTQPLSTTDNQTGNSTVISSQNLPPRLRQTSTNETEYNVQQSTTNYPRRHRSILPRPNSNYYSSHPPPPPLMTTPPGVLFPYPPTLHQTGHIAYNIRTPDELELLAFQQQFLSPPLIWSPPGTYPHFPSYSMYGPSPPYMYNNSPINHPNNIALNPEADEWIPSKSDTDNNNILIDDEIHFPPLNNNSEQKSELDTTTNTDTNPPISPTETDTITNPNFSSSKLTTITYSTVILQTPDRNKSNNNSNKQYQRPNHVHVQFPTKQRTQIRVSKEINSRRRQPPLNRNLHSTEIPKQQQQQQSADDWIEVKSKKTKKFDRSINDCQYENSSQKLVLDEQIHKTLSSTGENTPATCTSEEEELSNNKVVMIVENKTITTTTDYNQIIVDDIHRKLDNSERLLIIIRGCPGSGKSTLAKSLNNGYHGQIFSTDEYFKDINLNEYLFDPSKLEKAHLYNRRLASDAFKRNISPIIIDNTNTTSWEMKPYVAMGKEAGYDILLIEPQTPWRYKPRELVKRNLHNLPLRRIKEILNRFEHNVTVQSIIDQMKSNLYLPCQSQEILDQHQSIDSILISKKSYDIIDDSNILDDVRLCINDMILFLTSNFYQTSLLIPFSDLSLIPTSPSTPHSLFHRSLSRFSTTTTNQDHSRLPTTTFSRCFENFTPPSSINSTLIGKKRRKNKNKQQQQQQSNEILFNTNNNNNNTLFNEEDYYLQQSTYHVYLPEHSSDFIVIDEQENIFW